MQSHRFLVQRAWAVLAFWTAACGATPSTSIGGDAGADVSAATDAGDVSNDVTADAGADVPSDVAVDAAADVAADSTGDSFADSGGDSTTGTPSYAAIVIWDKSADPAFVGGQCGSSPGADIDAVGLIRGGKLIAVGKPGTANYAASTVSTCSNKKNIATTVEGPPNGHVYAASPDDGYLSLNGGSVELQFGTCTTSTTITSCDGKGSLVSVQSGDDIVLYEVDGTYKAGSGSPTAGNAYDGCVCYADEYELDLRLQPGQDTGSIALPQPGKGNSPDKKWYAGSTTIHVP